MRNIIFDVKMKFSLIRMLHRIFSRIESTCFRTRSPIQKMEAYMYLHIFDRLRLVQFKTYVQLYVSHKLELSLFVIDSVESFHFSPVSHQNRIACSISSYMIIFDSIRDGGLENGVLQLGS